MRGTKTVHEFWPVFTDSNQGKMCLQLCTTLLKVIASQYCQNSFVNSHVSGSSVPSAFLLWVMRELPPSLTTDIYVESRPVSFISDSPEPVNRPQRWTTATSSRNQVQLFTKLFSVFLEDICAILTVCLNIHSLQSTIFMQWKLIHIVVS